MQANVFAEQHQPACGGKGGSFHFNLACRIIQPGANIKPVLVRQEANSVLSTASRRHADQGIRHQIVPRRRTVFPASLLESAVNDGRLSDPRRGDGCRSSQLDRVQFDKPIVKSPGLEGDRDAGSSGIAARLDLGLNGDLQRLSWLQVKGDFLSSHFPMRRFLPDNLSFDRNPESRWYTQARVEDLRGVRLVR